MSKGDIICVRWIKPVARCSPLQTCSHMIFSFPTPQVANEVLVCSLYVCHKKVYAEKCKREPLCCLKYHGWGHLACSCLVPTDMCSTCTQCHCTNTCTNQARPHCISCGVERPASWDRSYPVFQWQCQELDDRMEDNSLPYFPMAEVWTQVREPLKVAPQRSQPPPPRVLLACRSSGGPTPTKSQGQLGQGSWGPPAAMQENSRQTQGGTNGPFSSLSLPPHV